MTESGSTSAANSLYYSSTFVLCTVPDDRRDPPLVERTGLVIPFKWNLHPDLPKDVKICPLNECGQPQVQVFYFPEAINFSFGLGQGDRIIPLLQCIMSGSRCLGTAR